jgi:short-subunit dehydrogenase
MKILLTGNSSGLGQALHQLLDQSHEVDGLTRNDLDLSDSQNVIDYRTKLYDMVIHCAGTGIGGKLPFADHNPQSVNTIIKTNLLSPILLTNKLLQQNPHCKVVCITSTNNKHYYPNDLAYSLSKTSLSIFLKMLHIDYPKLNYLEVQLGLTKTEFNNNRYKNNMDRFQNLYQHAHLEATYVAQQINQVLFNNHIKFIEISP